MDPVKVAQMLEVFHGLTALDALRVTGVPSGLRRG
jgi:hypothetical protein